MSDPTAPEMYAEVNIKDMPQPEAGDASGSAAPAGGAEEAVVEEPSVVGGIAVDEDMAAQTPSEAGAGAEAEAEPNGGAAAGDVEGGGAPVDLSQDVTEDRRKNAARDIQAVARGRAARQQVQGVRQDQAAVRIQAAQRGKAARRGMGMVSPPSSSMVRTLLLSPAVAVCRPLDRCWCMYA
jgi:hypothetical protein